MGYSALACWQCAWCFSTFEICNPYLVRPEPIVSPFQSRMDEHVCSQWINRIGWIVFLGRFDSNVTSLCFLARLDYCLVLQRQKITLFPSKWYWFSCQSQCLARESTNLSQNGSVSTDFVPEPKDEYVSLLHNLPTNKRDAYRSYEFWEHILTSNDIWLSIFCHYELLFWNSRFFYTE